MLSTDIAVFLPNWLLNIHLTLVIVYGIIWLGIIFVCGVQSNYDPNRAVTPGYQILLDMELGLFQGDTEEEDYEKETPSYNVFLYSENDPSNDGINKLFKL